ncbi:MAG TPA: hypothetical protein VHH34_22175, partial [Pseudonocardiaceae bacterium]|nr:hypothetical protein [Pseudonocardiaceae bacterium]
MRYWRWSRLAVRVAGAGPWLGAVQDWSDIDVERALMASLRWDDRFEDREQALVVVCHSGAPDAITAALRAALVIDAELAAGMREWRRWPDPFGAFHANPCTSARHGDAREQDGVSHDGDGRPGSGNQPGRAV